MLIGPFTKAGYRFQLKAQGFFFFFFLSVIQLFTMLSLLHCRYETEQQLQSVLSHHMLKCSRYGIACCVENGLNYRSLTLLYTRDFVFQWTEACSLNTILNHLSFN